MDISKIKLGSNTYDIKDLIARNGFQYATLTTTTSASYHSGTVQFSAIAFYGDSAKTLLLGIIPLDELAIPILAADACVANEVSTPSLTITDSTANATNSTTITTEFSSNNPVIKLTNSSIAPNAASGTPASTYTITIPVGANGTVAMLSDLTALLNAINSVNSVLDLNGEDVTTTIDTFNEVKAFLDDYTTSNDLASLLAGKVETITYDETNTAPKLTYKKTSSGSATEVVTLDTTPTNGSKKPITSGGVYTAINNLPAAGITSGDISAWNAASGNGLTNVSYTTSGTGNSQKHLLLKTIGSGSPTSFVELPTATYDSTTETLELVLAKTPA